MKVYEFESAFDTVNDDWQDEINGYHDKKSHDKKSDIKHSKDREFKKSFDKSFEKSFDKKFDKSDKSFDKRQTGKDRFYDNEPVKSDKPKVRYEKIDGKLVATPINNAQANQSNQPKKYVLKPKS